MLANPIVEELILAGHTPTVAAKQLQKEESRLLRCWGTPDYYEFGTIRICPPLKCAVTCGVAERFRAFVTWLPIDGR